MWIRMTTAEGPMSRAQTLQNALGWGFRHGSGSDNLKKNGARLCTLKPSVMIRRVVSFITFIIPGTVWNGDTGSLKGGFHTLVGEFLF